MYLWTYVCIYLFWYMYVCNNIFCLFELIMLVAYAIDWGYYLVYVFTSVYYSHMAGGIWWMFQSMNVNKCCIINFDLISLRLLALILCSNCSNTFNKVLTTIGGHLLNYFLKWGGSLELAQNLPSMVEVFHSHHDLYNPHPQLLK